MIDRYDFQKITPNNSRISFIPYRIGLKYLMYYSDYVILNRSKYLNASTRQKKEDRYVQEKVRQRGIEFPSPSKQEHIFIVRFNISDSLSLDRDRDYTLVRDGLRGLCKLFDKIDNDVIRID